MRRWLSSCRVLFLFTFLLVCKSSPGFSQNSSGNGNDENNQNTQAGKNKNRKEIRLEIPHYPLRDEQDLDILMEQIGDSRIVLLGEASHGTSEYYTWRTAISKRLIEEKGFDFIAVEGEWADSYRVNEFIKGPPQDSAAVVSLLKNYNRWPTWMWGNYEVAALVHWLNQNNQPLSAKEKTGFFGLDVYCLWESMSELMPYLQKQEWVDPAVLKAAEDVHQCFQPYSSDPQEYALAVANASASCRAKTRRLWKLVQKLTDENPGKSEMEFAVEQNILVALNGEKYYRTMINSNAESWNIRDRHMTLTLKRLLELHGPESRAIVWEHNTHIGDARYTDMADDGMVNVGQLVRKEFGKENVFAVGFGSYSGSVIAAGGWSAPLKVIEMPQASEGSWENILHQLSPRNKIILSKDIQDNKYLKRPIGHRAIGVVYNPALEHYGNYVPSIIPKRYDAFLFIDQTQALHPLETPLNGNEPPDLYPWGL